MPKKTPAPPPPRKPKAKATKEETLAKAKAKVAEPKPAAKARPGKARPEPEPEPEPAAAPGPALAGPAGTVDVIDHEAGLALVLTAAAGHVARLGAGAPGGLSALVLLPGVRGEDRPMVELLVRAGYVPRFEEDFACWSAPGRAALWRRDDEGVDTLGPLRFGHSDKGAGELVLVVDPFSDAPESGDALVWSVSWTDGVAAAVTAAAGPDAPAAALAALFPPDETPAAPGMVMPDGVGDGATSEDW